MRIKRKNYISQFQGLKIHQPMLLSYIKLVGPGPENVNILFDRVNSPLPLQTGPKRALIQYAPANDPIGPFAILKPKDQEIGEFYEVQKCRSTDFQAPEL